MGATRAIERGISGPWARNQAFFIGALRHDRTDRVPLHLDLHAVSDLDAARKDSPTSVTLPSTPPAVTTSSPDSQLRHQVLVFFLALLLRADEQEVEDDKNHDQRQHAQPGIGGRRRALRPGVLNEEAHFLLEIPEKKARHYGTEAWDCWRARNAPAKAPERRPRSMLRRGLAIRSR